MLVKFSVTRDDAKARPPTLVAEGGRAHLSRTLGAQDSHRRRATGSAHRSTPTRTNFMNSLVTPVSKKARKKMRAAVALLAQQGARQKAAASEAQAEASLALECDKQRTRSTGDSWTAKEADRVQADVQRWRTESDLKQPKVRFCWRGRHAWVGSARAKHEAAEGRGARKKERKKTDNPREGRQNIGTFFFSCVQSSVSAVCAPLRTHARRRTPTHRSLRAPRAQGHIPPHARAAPFAGPSRIAAKCPAPSTRSAQRPRPSLASWAPPWRSSLRVRRLPPSRPPSRVLPRRTSARGGMLQRPVDFAHPRWILSKVVPRARDRCASVGLAALRRRCPSPLAARPTEPPATQADGPLPCAPQTWAPRTALQSLALGCRRWA